MHRFEQGYLLENGGLLTPGPKLLGAAESCSKEGERPYRASSIEGVSSEVVQDMDLNPQVAGSTGPLQGALQELDPSVSGSRGPKESA